MFELKKIIAALIMPMPALLIIGFSGLLCLWFSRHKRVGSTLASICIIGLFLLSFQPISSRLLMPIERQHTAFIPGTDQPINYVLVLGHGHVVDDDLSPTASLSRAALMRLTEGIRILRHYPNATLILSGYSGGTEISHARMLAKVAIALGVSKNRIVLLETAQDTWEEARQSAVVVGDNPFVVVTSASHMPRALNEFRQMGLEPLAAPTNYLANQDIQQFWHYTPQANYLEQSERFWYETLGQYWQSLRDKVIDIEDPEPQQTSL
ncbi:envelope biogenesis factor ElyC [Thaumasiovibrio subtropicus]|uniref:envelope biogenesis factor ElyC n=1 Tax=Thaumasiovibrio subtropicus TaxID=1891207 RepID=UPI000B351689|nr:envelope biogenesis factor ElyC [Thaumasiovibrio subtropicus]